MGHHRLFKGDKSVCQEVHLTEDKFDMNSEQVTSGSTLDVASLSDLCLAHLMKKQSSQN